MTDIRPFTINIDDKALEDLQTRLALTRLPEKETPDDWSQGIPLAYMREIVDYWRDDYDWRRGEAHINQYPQFITNLDGLDIHFLHVRSPVEDARPLILTHGWPGSIVEFLKVIDPLTNPAAHGGSAADAFHVVCPTLPGFGFSGKPDKPGWDIARIAGAWGELMARLGYEKYFAQGGDWGSAVTCAIPLADPEHCQAIHINMPIVAPDPETMSSLTDQEQDALGALQFYNDKDSGYSKQQSTRPQTLGYALVDSPAGQAAWILEKFYFWTDCKGHPENILSRDELLDNVMLYWLTASGASSARIYWESFNNSGMAPISHPAGISQFPKDIFRTSKRWAEKRFTNLIYWNALKEGGHFAALEQPEAFVEEVRGCFRLVR